MENTTILNSYIIGASVANLSIANLMDPVRILFRNIEPTEVLNIVSIEPTRSMIAL